MSCEPCPMCAGAINALETTWALVFVCSSAAHGGVQQVAAPTHPMGATFALARGTRCLVASKGTG